MCLSCTRKATNIMRANDNRKVFFFLLFLLFCRFEIWLIRVVRDVSRKIVDKINVCYDFALKMNVKIGRVQFFLTRIHMHTVRSSERESEREKNGMHSNSTVCAFSLTIHVNTCNAEKWLTNTRTRPTLYTPDFRCSDCGVHRIRVHSI